MEEVKPSSVRAWELGSDLGSYSKRVLGKEMTVFLKIW